MDAISYQLVAHLRERATFVQQQHATGHAPDDDQLRLFLTALGASVTAGLGPEPTAALKAAVVAAFATIGWDFTGDQPAASSKEPPTATAVVDCIRALEVVAATAEEKRAVAAPDICIVYRDGLSESQLDEAETTEVEAVRAALAGCAKRRGVGVDGLRGVMPSLVFAALNKSPGER